MQQRLCPDCHEMMAADCFRTREKKCVWCEYASMNKRALARYRDIVKRAPSRAKISGSEFVSWYQQQRDCCAYCGLMFAELKRLKLRRGRRCYVSWDIDRVDSSRPYEVGNLALACFVCNMAKGDMLSGAEARTIGQAVREVWNARLTAKGA